MRFPFKLTAIVLGVFVGVVLIAGVLFFVFFPKDWAVAQAEQRIEAATERDLSIGGDVNLTFWPSLGFSAQQASLSNPEGFSADAPFLSAERIVFAIAIMPLLRGDIEVKQLIFEGAQLRLMAKPDGAANWTFPTEEEEGATLEDLRLDEVRLVDGMISFQGGQGEEPLAISDVDAALALDSLDAPATLNAAFDYRGQRVSVDATVASPRATMEQGETPLTAEIYSTPLQAEFDGAFNAENGALQGRLTAEGDSLRALSAWMGSPMGEGRGFGEFNVAAAMRHLGQETQLTNAMLRVDNVVARGAVTLIAQESGKMRVNGALSAASVDMNAYLPAPPDGEAGVQTNTAWSTDPLDLSGLRALDANLDLTLGALQFQRMAFSDVRMALVVANGAADARLSQIALYGGAGTARMIADGSGATPRIAVELNVENVQAEPLLTAAIGFDKIAGRGQLRASLVGQGNSQAGIMRSLAGNAAFTFNDGQWKGVNLAQVARTIQSALSGQETGAAAATDFAELSSTLQIASGVAATDNLRMLNPFVRLEGQGLIDIGGQTIDMRIAPRAVRSIEGQGGDAAVTGLGIPFRVSGPWSRVSFRPDLGDVVQNELRNRIGGIL
ncbi:MAG: AsmA family protein, partial [Hyphomonadaceae bacterium]